MSLFYRFFKAHTSNSLVTTAAYAWLLLRERLKRRPAERPAYSKGCSAVKAAVICDRMTYEAFRRECGVVCLTPWNWRGVLREDPPDFLLCESAWAGVPEDGQCWRGRIYRNHSVGFEHRGALFKILDACGAGKIPTVFWNKEDPAFFGNPQYDFVDTALRFDYIFTTAEECAARYQALGHRNVHVLPFGFSPELFNPLGSGRMERKAFFAGSWYCDQPERCRDLKELFRYLEQNGVPCTIYDRNAGRPGSANRFPEPYQSRCRPAVPYTELDGATKAYLYGLNVNTVRDSGTMFARRVYEMMAGNHLVVSNRSEGLEREFPDSVWYCGQEGLPEDAPDLRRRNLEYVFRVHTYEKRLDTILRVLGLETRKPAARLYLFGEDDVSVPVSETGDVRIERRSLKREGGEWEALPEGAYAAVLRDGAEEADWPFLLTQFAYLPEDCGIRWGKPVYEIKTDGDNWNCVFPARVLGSRFQHFSEPLKKLEI